MIYKNYKADISFSEEEDLFIGRVVNIQRDIIAFDGRSVEELKQAFQMVIEEYLQDCVKAGKQPEQPTEKIAAWLGKAGHLNFKPFGEGNENR